jgi:hypothetical protein
MASRWLFAGGDLGMMRQSGAPIINTSTATRNSTYADHSLRTNATTDIIYADFIDSAGASDSVTSGEAAWLHWTGYYTGTASAATIVALLNGSDQPWLALRTTTGSGTLGLYYNSGTGASPTWTLIGSTFAVANTTRAEFDIKLTISSPHEAELYKDGSLVASGTFTQASLTAIEAALFTSPNASAYYYSEIMASVGINTVGGHVYYGKPSGAGATSGWTGASTTIDDVGIDDTDLISSGSAGQKSTFAYADVPALASGYALGDLFMWTRGKNDGAAPANIKPVRRTSGGVDNVGSSFTGIGAGFVDFLTRYSGITETEYNGSQFGVESAT